MTLKDNSVWNLEKLLTSGLYSIFGTEKRIGSWSGIIKNVLLTNVMKNGITPKKKGECLKEDEE